MKCKTLMAAMLLAGMTAQTAFAQPHKEGKRSEYPYAFVGVQGGAQLTWTNYTKKDLITPIGAVSIGGMFSPVVGTRLHVSGFNTKGGIKSLNKTYDYKFVTSDLDLMINLSNAIRPHKRNWVNAYLIGGVGLAYTWDNDDLKALASSAHCDDLNLAWDKDRLVHNFRVGMQLEANINRFIGVNVELTANNLHDRFNSKVNGHGDWQLQALAGINIKLGSGGKRTPEPAPRPMPIAPPPAPQPAPEPKPEPKTLPAPVKDAKPVVVKALESTSTDIFFNLGSSDVTAEQAVKLESFANWMKAHPTAKAELLGYADKGTGTEEVNRAISEKRAKKVASILTEKYGIDASRLSTGYKGDDVQPFRKNDSNRVVMCTAKEQQ